MSFTLRGRIDSRLAAALAPLLAAGVFAAATRAWWPLQLAGLMIAVGLALDLAVYHRAFPYQPAWAALPLGLIELAAVIGLVGALGVAAPLGASLALYGGAWLLAQALVHAGLPLLRLSYGDDGGELGAAGPVLALSVLAVFTFAGGLAYAKLPPTVRLAAGITQGPLVLDRPQKLIGEPGAVVRGGIVITADGVSVKGVTVLGGEYGVEVDGAVGVRLEDVRISGATLDGIHVRRSQVTIRDCIIQGLAGSYTQAIDISFGFDRPPSVVEGCTIHGGREGIVTHFAHARLRRNRISGTTLRAITVTEMSAGTVEGNVVRDALGVGIFCGDYSECEIAGNEVSNTRQDPDSGDRTRMGYAIVAHYGATARLTENQLAHNDGAEAAFLHATITRGPAR